MVFDQLRNLNKYVTKGQFEKISGFLKVLSSDMREGYYAIDGEAIYARVMRYQTSLRQDCRIESHDKYIDIQSSLVGIEGIDIFDRNELDISQAYNNDMDVTFYEETVVPNLSVSNRVGYFSMIFPKEAHRPKISVNQQCEEVKKFVIKIHVGDVEEDTWMSGRIEKE